MKKIALVVSMALVMGLTLSACGKAETSGKSTVYAVEAGSAGEAVAKENNYQRRKKQHLFGKRAGIEPTIAHLKRDCRLGRNFYKGIVGDSINVMLAAAAYNFKRAMKVLLDLIQKISETLLRRGALLNMSF